MGVDVVAVVVVVACGFDHDLVVAETVQSAQVACSPTKLRIVSTMRTRGNQRRLRGSPER